MKKKASARHGPAGRAARAGRAPLPGRLPFLAGFFIVLAGIATYWNGLHAPFIWDDASNVVSNQSIRSIATSLRPPTSTSVVARPLVNLTFAVNYSLGGLSVFGYHAGNLLIHVSAALLLFGITRRTLEGPRLRPLFGGAASAVALLATLWWTVHPLTSEVIEYVTQRTEALMALCLFATLYTAVRALDRSRRTAWTAVAIAVCFAGVLSKQSMAIAPIVVVLYDRVFVYETWPDAWQSRRILYSGLAAGWLLLAFIVWLRPEPNVGVVFGITPWTYALNQLRILPRYFELAFVPHRLVVDYGLPRPVALAAVWPYGIAILLLIAAVAVSLFRRQPIGLLGAVFLLGLAPTSSIIPITTEVGAERRMYVPLAALAVAIFAGGWALLQRRWLNSAASGGREGPVSAGPRSIVTAGRMRMAGAIACIWIVALAARTIARTEEYSHPAALWQKSIERWPHGRARFTYAMELVAAGNHPAALVELRQAVEDFPYAHLSYGIELAYAGDVSQGIDEIRRFLAERHPPDDLIAAHLALGRLLASERRVDESASEFRAVLALAPRQADANASLGDLLMAERKYGEAVGHYRVFVEQVAGRPEAVMKLAVAEAAAGQKEAAAQSFQQVVALDSQNVVAYRSLANLLLELRRISEMETYARRAVELDPRNADSQNLLGLAMAARGATTDALVAFRRAVDLDPTFAEARANLAHAERLLGTNPRR